MPPLPDTRETLIRRLPDAADVEAWDAFIEIYEPLLFRLARSKGFQQADAEDFVQEVLAAVSKAVGRWVDDENRGTFKAWLFRIAQNMAINFMTRPRHQRLGSGDSQIAGLLAQHPDPSSESTQMFALEYRRELFRCAAEQVRTQVNERQWQAFWKSSVEAQPIPEVAAELEMSVGSIYIARSRITKRIREKIFFLEEQSR
ncbi:sigma-70 family RNA polymerase sigma factor [Blastopirellula sp. JC732]|uniref:Sigma-70 family RNA polymerase sigma factor n=1 Tax=Blastopirellula sediminis TaxID=2894196 RepID=A0A9X1MMB0_9BACT|nr:sigma-70 family RNA polymerase sigma factor [Blastopirellula sediminis]MCC9606952.1 sigma-70 family RNA polymerase sigma factor [Blastopirellula sediminis]MCC9629753.1 sigma-70 family RNA polymerase sigma factor [Blastopirellula sediminis]